MLDRGARCGRQIVRGPGQVDAMVRWVSATIGIIGVSRCMFGSHMPVARLSTGFADLYQ
jgi:predicted TIM-barrel fold metal-dependent hydrolase